MVVSIELAVSLATIFSLLSNLQAPITCENTYSIVSQLTVPQNINYESLKYPEPVKTTIKEAWGYAYLAKKSAQSISANTYLCMYLSMPAPKGTEALVSLFIEALTKTRTNYYLAIAKASELYSFELKQAEKDYVEMDKAGFDVLNNSFEKLQFEKTKKLLLTSNKNTRPSNVYELQSVQETIIYNLQKGGPSKGVVFFNQFVGNGKAIDLYEQNHENTQYLLKNFEKRYKDKLKEVKAKQSQLQEKINNLQSEGVLEMDYSFQKQLPSPDFYISYSSSTTPKSQLEEMKKVLKKTTTTKAEFIYSLKKENYLAEAYLELVSNSLLLDSSIREADSLDSKIVKIEKDLREECFEYLSKTDPSSPVYMDVRKRCNSEGTLAQRMKEYSEAVKIAKGDYSDYLYLEDFIENSLNQLQKTGVPLSLESKQFENIKNSEASIGEKYSSLLLLKDAIVKKASGIKQSFEEKQGIIEGLVSVVGEKRDFFEMNSFELSSDEFKLKEMNSKEFCPNAFDLLQEQEALFKKYSSLVSKKAGAYLSSNAKTSFYFKKAPECDEKQEALEVVSIYNDLANLEDISFFVPVFNNSQKIFIPKLEEGRVYSREFKKEVVPLHCSPQIQEEENGLIILKRTVSPVYPLQKARVSFNLPENASVLSSSGLFENNSVFVDSVTEPTDVFVVLSFSTNATMPTEDLVFNDSFFLNNSENLAPPSFNFSYSHLEGEESTSNKQEEKSEERLLELLFDYKKAVDDNVQISHQETVNNYSYYEKKFNKLTGLSVEEFNKEAPFLELELKNEINSLKLKAEQEYNKAVSNKANEIFLNRAKEWLEKGYYTRSILYSQFALSLAESQKPQWIFAIAFVSIVFAAYLALRKKEEGYEKKVERKLYSFD